MTNSARPTRPATTEATGTSKGKPSLWAFEEAFTDAIAQLGSASPGTPDWQDTYVVAEIGARIGGIVPVSELYVRVRRG